MRGFNNRCRESERIGLAIRDNRCGESECMGLAMRDNRCGESERMRPEGGV